MGVTRIGRDDGAERTAAVREADAARLLPGWEGLHDVRQAAGECAPLLETQRRPRDREA